ncbi:hypothetical protein ABIF65_001527 [Bradyrhizobium japonicum]|nr:hypothetical protein [Bradyrhizobium japonicum]MCP1778247.1 hypothetical protein [Bradyrhizobium japonicum]MCP1857732.1 hypothetical protein [Bradyrhizobium japonicum]MCP1888546.1 hypothetical protein [Bradyrhizobium japonicum]MCP1958755.1 hypothetical protein [Bradyrhizobium japonicum]
MTDMSNSKASLGWAIHAITGKWPRGSLQIPPGVVSQIPPPARQDKGLLV